jgi:hypothetical protein
MRLRLVDAQPGENAIARFLLYIGHEIPTVTGPQTTMTIYLHELMLMLVSSLVLSGCVDSLRCQPPPPKWATGFWYWHGDSTQPASAKETPDALYVHAGRIWKSESRSDSGHWYVDASLPNSLPQAREYWLVFRAEQQGVPDLSVAPMVTREVSDLLAEHESGG